MTADLSALIARLEAAEVGSDDLSAHVWCAVNDGWRAGTGTQTGSVIRSRVMRLSPPVTTSLDAALALAERVLGNGPCVLHRNGPNEWGFTYVDDDTAYAATPALSVCIAILRAKQGEG